MKINGRVIQGNAKQVAEQLNSNFIVPAIKAMYKVDAKSAQMLTKFLVLQQLKNLDYCCKDDVASIEKVVQVIKAALDESVQEMKAQNVRAYS